jgi:hypothetical protein
MQRARERIAPKWHCLSCLALFKLLPVLLLPALSASANGLESFGRSLSAVSGADSEHAYSHSLREPLDLGVVPVQVGIMMVYAWLAELLDPAVACQSHGLHFTPSPHLALDPTFYAALFSAAGAPFPLPRTHTSTVTCR